jgi:hypothetical protein
MTGIFAGTYKLPGNIFAYNVTPGFPRCIRFLTGTVFQILCQSDISSFFFLLNYWALVGYRQ